MSLATEAAPCGTPFVAVTVAGSRHGVRSRGRSRHEWVVEWEGDSLADAQLIRVALDAGAATLPGAERAVTLSLTGTVAGQTTLRLVRRRVWQPEQATLEAKVRLTVRDG